jgi:DNA-binding response OmpR family regulator
VNNLTRVLVVHEDAAVRNLVRLTLGQSSYGVVEAQDVDAAMRMASTWGADLVIINDELPSPGAGAVLSALRVDPKTADVRVLLLGDKDDPPGDDRRQSLQVDAVLNAPFGAYALLQSCDALRARGD